MYRSEYMMGTGSHTNLAKPVRLGRGAKGLRGTVLRVGAADGEADSDAARALERRLLEIGFVEGAAVEIIHEGFLRGDPIAVKLDDMRVALRRRDAEAVVLRVAGPDGRDTS